MPPRRLWSREELIVVLNLYFQLPFGKLSSRTKEVRELAALIGRTDNSVALRLVNFAACDPYILATGRHGMSSGVNVCKPIWDEFVNDREELTIQAEMIKAAYKGVSLEKMLTSEQQQEVQNYQGEERERLIKTRLNQNAFRSVILENYEHKCAITGIDIPELLTASHIVPWADDPLHRLDPANGLCLSALYDRAFDKGLIAIDPADYTIILSNELKEHSSQEYYDYHFGKIERQSIIKPIEYLPNPDFLQYHIEHIFSEHN